jgi:hypothetical protein
MCAQGLAEGVAQSVTSGVVRSNCASASSTNHDRNAERSDSSARRTWASGRAMAAVSTMAIVAIPKP